MIIFHNSHTAEKEIMKQLRLDTFGLEARKGGANQKLGGKEAWQQGRRKPKASDHNLFHTFFSSEV